MEKIKNFVFNNFFPLILISLAGILAWANYTPNTFLTGWDTLHPEFNFGVSLKNMIFGAFRADQGLGTVAIHSHMSELVRLIFLWINSFIFPVSFLRYFWFFAMLCIGPLGAFSLIRQLSRNKKHSKTISFLGACYYLFNLATVQHFFVPFEMFATEYGFLPWLFLYAYKITELRRARARFLLIFALLSFFASPMAYAATLFYSYFVALALFLLSIVVFSQKRKAKAKRAIFVLFLVLVTNAFWILPNLYSVAFQSEVVRSSTINMLFSPEASLQNRRYGNLSDILIHKNFLFSWKQYSVEEGEFVPLLKIWQKHLDTPFVLGVGYLFSFIFVLGIVTSLIKKEKKTLIFLSVFLLSIFFLVNDNPPSGFLFQFLGKYSNLIKEGFRMPFTKFSIPFVLACSVFFSVGIRTILRVLEKLSSKIVPLSFGILTFVLFLYFSLPMFFGYLISPTMRNKIPAEYFELFDWFKKQEKGRVALFPVHSLWGWVNHDWGYEGAGFVWFGIDSPVLTRDFDRWSAGNETFYNQISSALYKNDKRKFLNTIEKFDVSYILIDESVINPGADAKLLYSAETQKILEESSVSSKIFESGFLKVYKVQLKDKYPIYSIDRLTDISAQNSYFEDDIVYEQRGDFADIQGTEVYPFVNYDERSGLSPYIKEQNLVFESNIKSSGGYVLNIPSFVKKESVAVASVFTTQKTQSTFLLKLVFEGVNIKVDGKEIYSEPIEINFEFNTKGKKVSFVSIGENVISVSDIEDVEKILISLTDKIDISIYGSDPQSESVFLKNITSKKASDCSNPDNLVDTKSEKGIRLSTSGNGESLCLGESFNLSKDKLVKMSFEFFGDPTYFCATKAGVDGCLNEQKPNNLSVLGGKKKEQYLLPLQQETFWFAFVLPGGEKKSQSYLSDISLQSFESLSKKTVSFSDYLSVFSKEKSIPLKDPKNIKVFVPTLFLQEEFALGRGNAYAKNCEIDKKGSVSKQNDTREIVYKAENDGISCDYFDWSGLDGTLSYLLRLQGQTISGRPMKLYLQNPNSQRMDREVLLEGSNFDRFIYLLGNKNNKKGYVLNVETRAFGGIGAENTISSLSFMPFPYHFLSGIFLNKDAPKLDLEKAEIKNISSFGNIFIVDVNERKKDAALILSQGYDRGWVAFGHKHFKVNGWANGWLLERGEAVKVIIFFAPDLLEFFGFIFLICGTILAYLRTKTAHSQRLRD